MVHNLLIAGSGILGLLALWLGVQSLARRQARDDCDGPDPAACSGCAPERAGGCRMRLTESKME